MSVSTLAPDQLFSQIASEEQIARTAEALKANGFRVLIAEDAEEAKKLFFENIPGGAQVHTSASQTLERIGIMDEVEKSGRFDAIRPKIRAMNRETQGNQIRRLGASPDYMAGSVHAVTEDGHVLIASMSGSQIGPYAFGAGKVVWVVGAQKIVADVAEGLRRVEEYVFPLEDERARRAYGRHSAINKLLIYNAEAQPGRVTLILVKRALGF